MPKSISRFELDKFLAELTELTKKYGITIDGCGCCGSPWCSRLEDGAPVGDLLDWDAENQKYVIDSKLAPFDF